MCDPNAMPALYRVTSQVADSLDTDLNSCELCHGLIDGEMGLVLGARQLTAGRSGFCLSAACWLLSRLSQPSSRGLCLCAPRSVPQICCPCW